MNNKIIQEFIGEINEVKIHDKQNYYTVLYLLELIEEKFGEVYTNEFVNDLNYTVETLSMKLDNFSYSELEWCFYNSISEANCFEDIVFLYYDSDWKIEPLNEKIFYKKYNKK